MSSTSPLLGRLCKIFSPRICLFAASLLFTIGTIITGIAPTFAGFLAGRAITGVGAAGIVACAVIIVLDLAPEKSRGLYISLVNTGFTVGVSLGAVLAGQLIASTGWREIFLMQAPLSLLAGIAVFFTIPKDIGVAATIQTETLLQQLAKIDYLGVLTLTTSLVLFLVSLASTKVLVTPIVLSAFTFMIFLLIESRFARDPIIPISVLKSRGVLFSALATATLMMTRWTVLFYSPVYAIAVRQWDRSLAGLMLVPANAGFAIGGLVVGVLHIKRAGSFYASCVLVIASFATTLIVLSQILSPSQPAAVVITMILANGIFTGAALNYTLVHVLHLTIPSTHFIMSSLMTTFRGFGASFGSAIGGGIFARALQSEYFDLRESYGLPKNETLLERLLGKPALVRELEGVDRDIALQSYVTGLSTLFLAGGIAALGAVLLQAGAGWTAPKDDDEDQK